MKVRTNNTCMALALSVAMMSFTTIGQSDNPCGAPALPVGGSCVNTTGTNVGATASPGVPAPGCANYSGGDVWYTITVPPSGNVQVETSNAGGFTDGGLAIYSGPCGSLSLVPGACNDDGGAGLFSLISLTGQIPGATLWIRVWEYGNNSFGNFNICAVEPPPPPTNVDCSIPDPICSGTPITFTAQANGTQASTVNPGNNYACLSTSPNPSWYYLEIATAGNLAIDITAGSDIDFELWGPFPNLANAVANCNSYGVPVDCSYSPAPTEQANAAGVIAGEVYVLLVTNFANTVQTISLNEAPSNTATTNCAILPVELGNFSGSFSSDDEVLVQWNTISENDNDYFIVERSEDGLIWSAFDVVDGVGNSQTTIEYQTIDRNPKLNLNYYRLKQFDTDGTMHLSDVISVTNTTNLNVQLFPNPVRDELIINASKNFNQILVSSADGSIVFEQTYHAIHQTSLNTSGYKNGIYFVSFYSTAGITVERVVIQH
jgi:hypothetical protein